ncbi:MAG: sensor histidine kinase [Chloroflexi bacterium OHK40]
MDATDQSHLRASRPGQVPAWALDLLLGIAVTLVIALVISADQGGRQPADAVAYLCAAMFGALMLLRRRFPVAVLVATMALLFTYYTLQYPAIGLAVPVAAALYSAAERGRVPAAIVVSLVLLVVSTYFRVRDGESLAYLGYELASTVTLLGGAIALGDGARARRALRTEQAETARLIAQEHAARAAERVQAERLRIARDLHDLLGHSLTVIGLHADVAREALDHDANAARAALSRIRGVTSETMRELRATVKLLRRADEAPPDQEVASLAQLDSLLAGARASGLHVSLQRDARLRPLPAHVEATAYRIIQEAVTNVLRHANATTVNVVVRVEGEALQIAVYDNGKGAAVPLSRGTGLAGMAERARATGGTLTAEPRPTGGFAVRATLPLGADQ